MLELLRTIFKTFYLIFKGPEIDRQVKKRKIPEQYDAILEQQRIIEEINKRMSDRIRNDPQNARLKQLLDQGIPFMEACEIIKKERGN